MNFNPSTWHRFNTYDDISEYISANTFCSHGESIARVLTAAAYAPEGVDTAQLAMNMTASAQLKRDSMLAEKIQGELEKSIGKDVSVADFEEKFQFKWRPMNIVTSTGVATGADPYYSQMITQSIADSYRDLLFSLPHRLAALPGLNAMQSIERLTPQLNHACNTLYTRLCPLLTGAATNATNATLRLEMAECAKELTRAHTEPTRRLITQQLSGMRVLQRICTAALSNEPIYDLLLSSDLLQLLATHPPRQFIDELARERVPFLQIAGFLVNDTRGGIRGAAAMPPNGATRELAVQRWAKRYGEIVLRCMVPVRQTLNILSNSPDSSALWHGVIVAEKNADIVQMATQTGGSTAAVPCTTAHHVHALEDLMLIATSTTDPVALLVPRLVQVVKYFVDHDILAVRKLNTDILLPLVTRWDCSAIIEREQLLASLGEQMESEYAPRDENDPMNPGEVEPVVDTVATMEPAVVPVVEASCDRFGPRITSGSVPLSLERDHAIVVCAHDLLQEYGGIAASPNAIFVLSVKAVVSRVLSRAYHSLLASEKSTIQSVGCVFTKLSQSLFHDADDAANVDCVYWKTDQPWVHSKLMIKPTGAALVMTDVGIKATLEQFDWIIGQMRFNGSVFAKDWFPSRSARSHSRRNLWQRRHGDAGASANADVGQL